MTHARHPWSVRLCTVVALVGLVDLATGKPALPDQREPVPLVQELTVPDLRPRFAPSDRGLVTKPLVVKSMKDLTDIFPDDGTRAALAGKLDWDRQHLLVFRWAGSGQDRLTARAKDGRVVFGYEPGRTRDLRPHLKLFAVRQGVPWSVERAPFDGPR